MNIKNIKKLLKPLLNTPFHPQWHTAKTSHLKELLARLPTQNTILDLGCADMWPKKILPNTCNYIGLDYYKTATEWYGTNATIYADAQRLPIRNDSIDHILCLDVIEHLESAQTTVLEMKRVLKNGGKAIIKVPFMYPLHDTPRDFIRITPFGIREIAQKSGLEVIEVHATGTSLQTSALLNNIAYTQLFINWIKSRNPLIILLPLLPLYILSNNLISQMLSNLETDEKIMPHSYTFILIKK